MSDMDLIFCGFVQMSAVRRPTFAVIAATLESMQTEDEEEKSSGRGENRSSRQQRPLTGLFKVIVDCFRSPLIFTFLLFSTCRADVGQCQPVPAPRLSVSS